MSLYEQPFDLNPPQAELLKVRRAGPQSPKGCSYSEAITNRGTFLKRSALRSNGIYL